MKLKLATTILFCSVATQSPACGYEDPQSIAVGALNLAFPDSLHLRTAIWQAQVDGVLPREPTTAIPASPTPNLTPGSFAVPVALATSSSNRTADPAQVIALMDAMRVIEQMRLRLATSENLNQRPSISMVYANKMLWTRFVSSPQGVLAQPHASGPETGDVVLITDPAVIQAMVAGTLTPEEASRRKLVRLYGTESANASAQAWLLSLAPPSAILITKE